MTTTKRYPTVWEKIFTLHLTNKELITKIYKRVYTTQQKQSKGYSQKIGSKPKKTLLQRGNATSQQAYGKKLMFTCNKTPTPVRMAPFQKTDNKWSQRCGEIGTLLHCCWECKLVQSLWKAMWSTLRILKMELPNDPAISVPSNLLIKLRNIN